MPGIDFHSKIRCLSCIIAAVIPNPMMYKATYLGQRELSHVDEAVLKNAALLTTISWRALWLTRQHRAFPPPSIVRRS